MDYSKIVADPVWGEEIGRLYTEASPYVTTMARVAYAKFVEEVDIQFEALTTSKAYGVTVVFQDEDPYTGEDAHRQMFEDVSRGLLRVYRTTEDQRHPILSLEQNNRFRAVHDFHGHFMTARGFDRHGEEAAWVRHSQMFSGLARAAMTTETRGQSSALVWINKGERFPEQKGILLPSWVSEIPRQYR